jgi:hypothetical protein
MIQMVLQAVFFYLVGILLSFVLTLGWWIYFPDQASGPLEQSVARIIFWPITCVRLAIALIIYLSKLFMIAMFK